MSCSTQMRVVILLQISAYLENGGFEKQHVYIKFCFKLAKNAMETSAMLLVALNSKQ